MTVVFITPAVGDKVVETLPSLHHDRQDERTKGDDRNVVEGRYLAAGYHTSSERKVSYTRRFPPLNKRDRAHRQMKIAPDSQRVGG
jgi:hypothetical protein